MLSLFTKLRKCNPIRAHQNKAVTPSNLVIIATLVRKPPIIIAGHLTETSREVISAKWVEASLVPRQFYIEVEKVLYKVHIRISLSTIGRILCL